MSEKQIAAEKAIGFIENNMILGLGSGSTVNLFLKKLGELIKKGLKVKGISTSNSTTSLALSYNIPLISLEETDKIDLTIDGADEVDEHFNGIKGGGGALLYEKIIAVNSKKNIWIVDSSKLVKQLGKFPLPVEVVPFGYSYVLKTFEERGFKPKPRKNNGENFQSDGNNFIIDLNLERIDDPLKKSEEIKLIAGVVETGLFINIPDFVLVGNKDDVKVIENKTKNL